jgi:hypothetical protein
MKRSKKILTNLINDVGLKQTSEMVGISLFELVKYTNCYIDTEMADLIIGEIIRNRILPKIYENCELYYDTFSGTLEWECKWDGSDEYTYTYATPFWDGQDGIPVETNSYSIKIGGSNLTLDDIDNDLKFNFISWKQNGFENIDSYIEWFENFYLPKVYDIIMNHLDNYRYIVESEYI